MTCLVHQTWLKVPEKQLNAVFAHLANAHPVFFGIKAEFFKSAFLSSTMTALVNRLSKLSLPNVGVCDLACLIKKITLYIKVRYIYRMDLEPTHRQGNKTQPEFPVYIFQPLAPTQALSLVFSGYHSIVA
jgi:hypothetical protein